jgi:transposase
MEDRGVAAHKKGASRLGAWLVFIGESGFMLTGTVARTRAPRGKTPATRSWLKHDRVSAISGLSVSPRRQRVGLYWKLHESNVGGEEVREFLRHLLRHLRGPVVAILDRSPTHRGAAMAEFLRTHARLHVEHLPGYAPEFNPDEGVWDQAKKALAGGRPRNAEELREDVASQLRRLRRSQACLRACIHASDLPHFL